MKVRAARAIVWCSLLVACAQSGDVPCPTGYVEDSSGLCRLGCAGDGDCLPNDECSGAGICVPRLDTGSPTISVFRAPATAAIGEQITIDYSVLFADGVELFSIVGGEPRSFFRSNALSGSERFIVPGTITLRLEAYKGALKVSREIEVTTGGTNAVRIDFFNADRTTVDPGDRVELTWAITNGDGTETLDSTTGPLIPDSAGFKAVAPTQTTTYTLTAHGADGSSAQQELEVMVNVAPEAPTVALEIVRSSKVRALDNLLFKWTSTNATRVELVDLTTTSMVFVATDPTTVATGRWLAPLPPGGTHRYQITAYGADNQTAIRSIAIDPVPKPPLPTFRDVVVDPVIADANGVPQISLTWGVTPASAMVTLLDNGVTVPFTNSSYSIPSSGVSHRFVLLAENETGVAEARISSWATIEESAPRAGNPPQVIDGFAVSGGFGDPAGGVALPLEEDEYTVTVPAGGFLTVIIEGSCNASTEVRVVDQSGTQLGQSSSNMGLCPGKIRVGPTAGVLSVRASTANILGYLPYTLIAEPEGPLCGDGIEASNIEACDEGDRVHDACDGYCQREPSFNYSVANVARPPTFGSTPLELTLMPPGPGIEIATEGVAVIELPTELSFYGHHYVGVMAHVDGYVSFYPDRLSGDLLTPEAPNGIIALFATDLRLDASSGITAATLTSPTGSAISIHYQNVSPNLGGATLTGSVVITTDGAIGLDYGVLVGTRMVEAGVQDASGVVTLLVPGCGDATNPIGACRINQLPESSLIQFLPLGHPGIR